MVSLTVKDPLPDLKDYVFIERVGSGSYGTVYKARKKTGSRDVVAVKCMRKSSLTKHEADNVVSEISLLKRLKHDFIVEMKDFSWDANYIYIIMEYCGGGDLSKFIKSRKTLPESVCRLFLQQLSSALRYLRQNNVAHMDLKPQNILLSFSFGRTSFGGPVLKMADFGFAQYLSKDQTKTSLRGSPLYMAPEMVLERKYDAKVDIWSVGVILFECLFGRAPYKSSSVEELLLRIKENKEISIPHSPTISSDCRKFLERCLKRDPKERLDFDCFFSDKFLDLEHMPCDESEGKGMSLADGAELAAKEGNLEEALAKFKDALDYLVPISKFERDSSRKAKLQKRVEDVVGRAEFLKSALGSRDGGSVESVSKVEETSRSFADDGPSNSLVRCSFDNPETKELVKLCSVTPKLKTGLEIVQDAELYELEGQYSIAIQKYETALGMIIPLIGREPKSRRKILLMSETKNWMARAEKVKELIEIQERVLNNSVLTGSDCTNSFDKHCAIQ